MICKMYVCTLTLMNRICYHYLKHCR